MPTTTAKDACEEHLRAHIRYNSKCQILPTESRIAEHLLSRSQELAPVYHEIYQKLPLDGIAWKVFLDCCVLATAAYWTPEKGREDRASQKQLQETNQRIAELASQLSTLLEQRAQLENSSPFTGNTHYHVSDLIDEANAHNGFYQSYLKKPLEDLRRFDLKYWPSIASVVAAIGHDAGAAEVKATDARTAALCRTSRPSKADFIRAMRVGIEENQHSGLGGLPRSFKMSDEALATLATVLLDLPADEVVDAKYVKNIRDRDDRQQRWG